MVEWRSTAQPYQCQLPRWKDDKLIENIEAIISVSISLLITLLILTKGVLTEKNGGMPVFDFFNQNLT